MHTEKVLEVVRKLLVAYVSFWLTLAVVALALPGTLVLCVALGGESGVAVWLIAAITALSVEMVLVWRGLLNKHSPRWYGHSPRLKFIMNNLERMGAVILISFGLAIVGGFFFSITPVPVHDLVMTPVSIVLFLAANWVIYIIYWQDEDISIPARRMA